MRRRKRGGGRPRKQGLKRHPGGRIKQGAGKHEAEHEMSQREALSVGLSARMRHHLVTRQEAKCATTGYLLGRLLERGRIPGHKAQGISRRQHDAGLAFASLRAAAHRVGGGPKAPGAVDLSQVRYGRASDEQMSDDSALVRREMRLMRNYYCALAAVSRAAPQSLAALEAALDEPSGAAPEITPVHLIHLRAGLDALAHMFGG